MPILMKADFKGYKAGQTIDPDPATADWLVSRQYAVVTDAVAAPAPVAAAPVVVRSEPTPKRGRK